MAMLRKKMIIDSIAFPTAAPAPAGLGRIKPKNKTMMMKAHSHRGMRSRLLPIPGQRQGRDGRLAS